jgi:hypothetical protein
MTLPDFPYAPRASRNERKMFYSIALLNTSSGRKFVLSSHDTQRTSVFIFLYTEFSPTIFPFLYAFLMNVLAFSGTFKKAERAIMEIIGCSFYLLLFFENTKNKYYFTTFLDSFLRDS